MNADLHVHTSFSDGEDTPEEVVDLAEKAGLTAVAITDHDAIDGIKRAKDHAAGKNVKVIPGIEFTTETADAEVHILGYFIDIEDSDLLKVLKKMQDSRRERIFKIVEKLKAENVSILPEEVFEMAKGESVGRPHVARVMIKNKIVGTIKEAFDKYLGWGKPAYEPHFKLTPFDAVKLIVDSGGIPVYAHPAISKSDGIIPDLIMAGLRGIEVHYPTHSKSTVGHYLNIARKNNLLITGGSDYHGKDRNSSGTVGGCTISDKLLKKLYDAREARA